MAWRRGRTGRRGLGVGLALGLALGLGVALGTSACAPLASAPSPASTASLPAAAAAPVTPAPATTAPAAAAPGGGATTAPAPAPVDISAELASLESTSAARIGVSAVDTATGRTIAYRADERFGYASTIKVFAASLLLRATPPEGRARLVTWTQSDVDAAGHSPATGEHVADGLSLAQLAEAAVRQSDNTALNVLLANLGGPQALDAALTQLGDDTSDVVDVEPALNTVEPGSTANTTTPAAFTADLRALLDPTPAAAAPDAAPVAAAPTSVAPAAALDPADRTLLLTWMAGNATGDTLIRAAAPAGWTVHDKSGGAGPIRNDIAVVTRPGSAPLYLSILTTRTDPAAPYDDALVAATARAVFAALPAP